MNLFSGKPSTTTAAPRPVWFLVERQPAGTSAFVLHDRTEALDRFGMWLKQSHAAGEGFSPLQRQHQLAVVGPDVHVRAEDDDAVLAPFVNDEHDDPLLIGAAALLAVLSPEEYRQLVHAPYAAALLES